MALDTRRARSALHTLGSARTLATELGRAGVISPFVMLLLIDAILDAEEAVQDELIMDGLHVIDVGALSPEELP